MDMRKHFEQHYYKIGAQGKRYRLVKKLKPEPPIFDPEKSCSSAESKHLNSSVSVPRKSQTKTFINKISLSYWKNSTKSSFDGTDSALTPPSYTFQKYNDHVVFYCHVMKFPEVTDYVRVNRDLHV